MTTLRGFPSLFLLLSASVSSCYGFTGGQVSGVSFYFRGSGVLPTSVVRFNSKISEVKCQVIYFKDQGTALPDFQKMFHF